MTDNEIITNLEDCFDKNEIVVSVYGPNDTKTDVTIQDVLDLINRQKAEIERLNEYISRCKSGDEYWVKCLLERPNEAIKEFADRLKKKTYSYTWQNEREGIPKTEIYQFTNDVLDNLVKEMVVNN